MSHGRNASLRRVLSMARYLETTRDAPSLRQLARQFGVTTRTIRRDLILLEEIHWAMPAVLERDRRETGQKRAK